MGNAVRNRFGRALGRFHGVGLLLAATGAQAADYGIAQKVAHDLGIEKDPDGVFAESFEAASINSASTSVPATF